MKYINLLFISILLLFTILCVGYAYFRFMVIHDYIVEYEGTCDPFVHNCFVECQNDTCTEKRYYDQVQKYATAVRAQCGDDITTCVAANECLPQDGSKCSIIYCDSKIEDNTCETAITP